MKIIEIIINELALSFIFLYKMINIYTTNYIFKLVIIPKALNMDINTILVKSLL